MKVYIDGKINEEVPPADSFQTVNEYLNDLEEDLANVNRVVGSALVDGKRLDAETREQICGEVDRLEIKIKTMDSMAVDSMGQLGEYCQAFLSKLPAVIGDWADLSSGEKEKYRQQVIEAFDITERVLGAVEVVLKVPSEEMGKVREQAQQLSEKLRNVDEDELKTLLREESQQFIEELLEHLQNVVSDLQQREENINEAIVRAEQLTEDLIERMPGLIDQLQQGGIDEQSGLEEIEETADNLKTVLDTVQKMDRFGLIKKTLAPEKQEELIEFNKQLNEGLKELSTALENRDIIMICDVLEYEVLPYLEQIKPVFATKE